MCRPNRGRATRAAGRRWRTRRRWRRPRRWRRRTRARRYPREAGDGDVDTDHATVLIGERATRVALVDRGVGLDEVLETAASGDGQLAVHRRHDAGGHRLVEAERASDGDGHLPDPGIVVRQRRRRHVLVDGDHGHVGVGVAAEHGPGELPPVRRAHRDLTGAGNDVGGGEDAAVGVGETGPDHARPLDLHHRWEQRGGDVGDGLVHAGEGDLAGVVVPRRPCEQRDQEGQRPADAERPTPAVEPTLARLVWRRRDGLGRYGDRAGGRRRDLDGGGPGRRLLDHDGAGRYRRVGQIGDRAGLVYLGRSLGEVSPRPPCRDRTGGGGLVGVERHGRCMGTATPRLGVGQPHRTGRRVNQG